MLGLPFKYFRRPEIEAASARREQQCREVVLGLVVVGALIAGGVLAWLLPKLANWINI